MELSTSMSLMTLGPSTLPQDTRVTYLKNYSNESSGDFNFPRTHTRSSHSVTSVADIFGASSSKPIIRSNPSNPLNVDDIEGAKARVRDKFHMTNRHINPLIPEYPLPSYKTSDPYENRFIKDSMAIDDIAGTRTKRSKNTSLVRDVLNVDDIEGASACWRPRHTRARLDAEPHEILYNIDNQKNKTIDKITSRSTNALDPVYQINGLEIKDSKRDTKPRTFKPYIADSSLLRTSDIDGAQAGSITEHKLSIPFSQRREFRNTNFIGDILGSNADSVKHSIVTTRATNPLQPTYQALDPGEVIRGPIDPLIPTELIDTRKSFKILGDSHKPIATSSHHSLASSTGNISAINSTYQITNHNMDTSTFDFPDHSGKPPLAATMPLSGRDVNKLKLDLPKAKISARDSRQQSNNGLHDTSRDSGRNSGRSAMSLSERRAHQEREREINDVRGL